VVNVIYIDQARYHDITKKQAFVVLSIAKAARSYVQRSFT